MEMNPIIDILNFYKAFGFERLPFRVDIMCEGIKDSLLDKLKKKIGDCKRCDLAKERKNIVFGEGNPDARLMFIGEAPGKEEDIQGSPFVGDAGALLTRLIRKMGMRREDVYIANVVKCRPPKNREPKEDEVMMCIGFLKEQIEIIRPSVIITLGKVASQNLLKKEEGIMRLRGNIYYYQIEESIKIPVIPTFHPAYLLRNPSDKRLTWEDACKALKLLSEKGAML